MTIEEYGDVRLELAQTSAIRLPEACWCTNCVAVLATLSQGDIIGWYIQRKLLGFQLTYGFNELLIRVVDQQTSLGKTGV